MTKEEAELLMNTVNNVFKTSPILLIGEECILTFSKAWEGKIVEIDKDNIKEVVEYYSITKLSYPLVIRDISTLNNVQVNYLLKLIEESKNPIILLASYDNLNNILLSRIKTVIKFRSNITSELKSDKESIEAIKEGLEKDLSYKDKISLIRDISPRYYLLESEPPNKNKDKFINIPIQ